MNTHTFTHATDAQLVAELPRLAQRDRASAAEFVAGLAEFDGRRLYLGLGFTSIYSYCAARLHLTDGAAYRRVEAARAARRFPAVLDMLRDGRLSLATAALLGPKLTAVDAKEVFEEAAFKSKRDVEKLLARRHPQPPVPSVVRKLPARVPGPAVNESAEPPMSLSDLVAPRPAPPSHRPIVVPLSEAHYRLQVTITTRAHERLREIQDLMRHRIPNGDPAAIVEHALDVLHADLLKKKVAAVEKPRTGKRAADAKGRYIPASVKRAVFRRDGGRCAFVGEGGRKCGARGLLEFHHVQPYAAAGDASVANLELRCRAHNGFEWTRHLDQESEALDAR